MDGVQEGDFAMIFGFPGNTQRYLTSFAVKHVMEVQDPMRIAMRRASLAVIDQAMRSNDLTRIQYAAKQASISNAYKKWIGELRGLRELDALEEKRALERDMLARAAARGDDGPARVLGELERLQAAFAPFSDARDLFIEMVYYGPEVLRFADSFRELADRSAELEKEGKLLPDTGAARGHDRLLQELRCRGGPPRVQSPAAHLPRPHRPAPGP